MIAVVPVLLVCARCGQHWHGAYRGPIVEGSDDPQAELRPDLNTRLTMSWVMSVHAGPFPVTFLTFLTGG